MGTPTVSLIHAKSHPLRKQLTAEMHVRLFPAFKAPARLTQFVTLSGEKDVDAGHAHAEALCRHYNAAPPENGRYFVVRLGDMDFVWERHTEFTTWTFIREENIAAPFSRPLADDLPDGWIEGLPGMILRGTQIDVLDRNAPEPTAEVLSRLFSQTDLVSCEVNGGEARVWSDFRLHDNGFGRLLIKDNSLVGRDTPRLVQRLQELGNYRKVALLGLPLAQHHTPRVTELERQLAGLSSEIAGTREKDEELLDNLTALTAELAKISAETRYRMSATRAYANIVADRLEELDVKRIAGFQTLTDFTERRLTPAVRTCESFTARLDDLSQRASWASSLMRTRIDTALERQNRDLLASMNRRAQVQLRLQQTVEGLSVAAISYYLVGLIGYMAKAAKAKGMPVDPALTTGVSVPMVILAIWFVLRRVRKHLSPDERQRDT